MNFTNIALYRKYFCFFESFIGATLQSLTFEQYLFNGEVSGNDIGSLELGFHSAGHLLLSLASDGETVIASKGQLSVQAGFKLEDSARCDWSREECNNEFIGQRLVAVDARINYIGASAPFTSGWIMTFESGFFGYHNFGDDAYLLYNQFPLSCDSVTTTIERVAGSIVT